MTDKIQSVLANKNLVQLTQDLDVILLAQEKFSKGLSVTSEVLKQMFDMYNLYYGKQEYGLYCASCRNKVYKGLVFLQDLIQENIQKHYG